MLEMTSAVHVYAIKLCIATLKCLHKTGRSHGLFPRSLLQRSAIKCKRSDTLTEAVVRHQDAI
jgi:hypothetical protein